MELCYTLCSIILQCIVAITFTMDLIDLFVVVPFRLLHLHRGQAGGNVSRVKIYSGKNLVTF